jgi:hypothetical protein
VSLRRARLKITPFVDAELIWAAYAPLRGFGSFTSPSRGPTDGPRETPSFPVRGTAGLVT